MITCIIFSKDRPLQLDLTLSSIRENFSQISSIFVIYKASPEYERAYNILMEDWNTVSFVRQGNYLLDSLLLNRVSYDDQICFMTDDNIVYRKVDIPVEIINLNSEKNSAACISLRLGTNITRGAHFDKLSVEELPHSTEFLYGYLSWNRTLTYPGSYWSYALSVDGHIFSKSLIERILGTMKNWPEMYSSNVQTPNKFETMLQRFFFEIGARMFSPLYSCVVNSPNNRVQNDYKNSSGLVFNYRPELLNELFLKGKRISFKKLKFPKIVSPHQEIDILEGLVTK